MHRPLTLRGALAAACALAVVPAGAMAAPSAPANITPPVLSGTATVGKTVASTQGKWAGSQPMAFSRAWLRCNAAGVSCLPIPDATGWVYTLTAADAGATVRSQISGANSLGTVPAQSAPSAVVADIAPTVAAAPSLVDRKLSPGKTLRSRLGHFRGSNLSFNRSWLRCGPSGGSCKRIAGATGPVYKIRRADVGRTIRLAVRVTNSAGSALAVSARSRLVTRAPATSVFAALVKPTPEATVGDGIHAHASSRGVSAHPDVLLPERQFVGVAAQPSDLAIWNKRVGQHFDVGMTFFSFGSRVDPTWMLDAMGDRGTVPMITWEPWKAPKGVGGKDQGAIQARYSNKAIAAGRQDAYIRWFARKVAAHKGTVMIRYAHEFNGPWYPWYHNPKAFKAAWRHVVGVFRAEGATNARFVWSYNANLYMPTAKFWSETRAYYPGDAYVDYVGSTAIRFGGARNRTRTIPAYVRRAAFVHRMIPNKKFVFTEVNVDKRLRVSYLRQLRGAMQANRPWLAGFVWSQVPSRATAGGDQTGNMNWQAYRDRKASQALRSIMTDVRR